MFCMRKKKKRNPAYVSRHNSKRENQVILLMILNGERCHYVEVKKIISVINRNNIKSNMVSFIACIVFIRLEKQTNLCENMYVKI